jgi:hypothetical protein
MRDTLELFGAWLSLVERLVRDQEAGGSNPLAPTNIYRGSRNLRTGDVHAYVHAESDFRSLHPRDDGNGAVFFRMVGGDRFHCPALCPFSHVAVVF